MSLSWKTSAAGACALALVLATTPAEAGRYCGDPLESGTSSGSTQEEALTAAQGWWSSRAGSLGKGYESWDNARDQAMECRKDQAGKFYCKATARPCLPDGVLPENVPKIEM